MLQEKWKVHALSFIFVIQSLYRVAFWKTHLQTTGLYKVVPACNPQLPVINHDPKIGGKFLKSASSHSPFLCIQSQQQSAACAKEIYKSRDGLEIWPIIIILASDIQTYITTYSLFWDCSWACMKWRVLTIHSRNLTVGIYKADCPCRTEQQKSVNLGIFSLNC